MQGKYKDYNWVTYGKDLVIYKEDATFDEARKGLVSVTYATDKFRAVEKVQIRNYNHVYDKELLEVLTPKGVDLVNGVRSQIIDRSISSMHLVQIPKRYYVYAPYGVGAVALENALRRAGIEARVREETNEQN